MTLQQQDLAAAISESQNQEAKRRGFELSDLQMSWCTAYILSHLPMMVFQRHWMTARAIKTIMAPGRASLLVCVASSVGTTPLAR